MTIKSGVSAASRCRQFQANRFDKIRCQACFRPRQEHCKEALECGKAARKAIRCGYLFLAPDNLDFGDLSQRKRRWQRRFFALFDDGQLIYALDQRPETIPHGSIDLLHCCGIDLFSPSAAGGLPEAEPVLAVRFAAPAAAEIERDAGAPTICNSVYVRAENLEETKRWFEGLREFVKENASASVVKGLALAPNFTGGEGGVNRQNQSFDERNFQSGQPAHIQWTTETGATAIRIGASSPSANGNAIKVDNDKSEPEETQRSKLARCVSGCYGTPRVNRRVSEPMPSLIDRILSPPNSSPVASVSHSKQSSQSSFNNSGSSSNHHGSVRSVKHRAAGQKNLEQCQSHTEKPLLAIDVDSVSTVAMASPSSPPICVVAQQPSAVGNDLTRSQGAPQQLQEHTVRKGWLMLRGRSADEWHKHWVVLTGLRLRLYTSSWTENNNTCEGGENSDDSNGKPVVDIDMSSCERVYPIGVSRNYGIEIRCKKTCYILSAATPGIRDSWIKALEQALRGEISPPASANEMLLSNQGYYGSYDCASPNMPNYGRENGVTGSGVRSATPNSQNSMPVTLNRKKRIAHVAPNDTRMSPEPETARNEPPSLAENVAGVREFSEQAIGYRRHLRGADDHGDPNVLRHSAYAHASVNRRTPPSLSRALGVSSAENAANSQRDRDGFSYSEPSIGVESSTADEQSSELNVRNFRERDGNNAATSATVRSRRRRSRCRLPPRQNSDSDDNSDNSTNQHSSLSPKLARRSPLGRVKQRKRVKSGSANGAAPAEDGPTASNATPRSSVDDNERAASDYIQLKSDGADIEAAVEIDSVRRELRDTRVRLQSAERENVQLRGVLKLENDAAGDDIQDDYGSGGLRKFPVSPTLSPSSTSTGSHHHQQQPHLHRFPTAVSPGNYGSVGYGTGGGELHELKESLAAAQREISKKGREILSLRREIDKGVQQTQTSILSSAHMATNTSQLVTESIATLTEPISLYNAHGTGFRSEQECVDTLVRCARAMGLRENEIDACLTQSSSEENGDINDQKIGVNDKLYAIKADNSEDQAQSLQNSRPKLLALMIEKTVQRWKEQLEKATEKMVHFEQQRKSEEQKTCTAAAGQKRVITIDHCEICDNGAVVRRIKSDLDVCQMEMTRWKQIANESRANLSDSGLDSNLAALVLELEQELLDVQTLHTEELTQQNSRVIQLQERLKHEEEMRKQLQQDLAAAHQHCEQSVSAVRRGHEELVAGMKREHDRALARLKRDQLRELDEERMATKTALDALQRAHAEDLENLRLKYENESRGNRAMSIGSLAKSASEDSLQSTSYHNLQQPPFSSQNHNSANTSGTNTTDSPKSHHKNRSHLWDSLSTELSELSAAYSAKCVENAKLQEELSRRRWKEGEGEQTGQGEIDSSSSESPAALLHTQQKSDKELEEYQQQIAQLAERLRIAETHLSDAKLAECQKCVKSEKCLYNTDVLSQDGDDFEDGSQIRETGRYDENVQNGEQKASLLQRVGPANDYRPQQQHRANGRNRRTDLRYHSTPTFLTKSLIKDSNDPILGTPVAERRKYFESLAFGVVPT